jgi:hypothetical protein
MKKRASTSPSKQKLNSKLVYFFWLLTFILAATFSSISVNNIIYANQSIKVDAKVHGKSSHRQRNNNSKSYSTVLKIIYQFENPYVKDKIELQSELAPLLYSYVKEGDPISIYYNEISDPTSRINSPLHYWFGSLLWFIFFSASYLTTHFLTKFCNDTKDKKRMFLLILAVVSFSPVLINITLSWIQTNQIETDQLSEQNWPSWPEFERAVAKPAWWDQVAIKYFDPMNYTNEEYSYYVENNSDKDKYHRQFKVTYALLLRHQDDPLQMGWDLARGTVRQYMPMYEFFLKHFMHQTWQGQCSNPCSDATQMVEMAGDLLSMKLDENQIDSSIQLIDDIIKYKYERANNRGKYYFLFSYRRLLEHTEGKENAREKLEHLVEANLQQAIAEGLNQQAEKWRKFWAGSQRKVGMFSKL